MLMRDLQPIFFYFLFSRQECLRKARSAYKYNFKYLWLNSRKMLPTHPIKSFIKLKTVPDNTSHVQRGLLHLPMWQINIRKQVVSALYFQPPAMMSYYGAWLFVNGTVVDPVARGWVVKGSSQLPFILPSRETAIFMKADPRQAGN